MDTRSRCSRRRRGGRRRPISPVCGLDDMSLATTIDGLVAAALLVPDGDDVRFRHELARAVFYGELAAGERARVHARLASCCEELRPERPGDIARHWSEAHDAPRALTASIAAGRQACDGAARRPRAFSNGALAVVTVEKRDVTGLITRPARGDVGCRPARAHVPRRSNSVRDGGPKSPDRPHAEGRSCSNCASCSARQPLG